MSEKEDLEKLAKEVDDIAKEPDTYTDPEMQAAKEERDAAIQAVMERKVFLSEKYVEPHRTPGRWIKEEDLPRVLEDAAVMHEMCMVGRGDYNHAFAIAHTQICDEDPLRFFVNADGQIYINPVIVDKSHEIHQVQEGCMSYPAEPMKQTVRFKDVTVRYRTVGHKVNPNTEEDLGEHFLTKETRHKLDGEAAQVMQHECQHLNGSDIYLGSSSDSLHEKKVDIKNDK